MPDNSANFEIIFKTIADATGITAIGQNIEALNAKIQGVATGINQALSLFGLSLGIEKLNEFSNKALESREALAAFAIAIRGSVNGSPQLVSELNELNTELEHTTGTSAQVSRTMEQLFARAGATGFQIKGLTKGVIEFAASSAGTIQPVELAATIARRLGGAADATDLSLSRLGLHAKDANSLIQELAIRGGQSAEAIARASGGMIQYDLELQHFQETLGGVINLFKLPFVSSFNAALDQAKEKLDGVSQSASGFGEKIFIASKIAGDSIAGIFTRGNLLFQEFYSMAQATGGEIAQFVLSAVSSVVGAIGTLITGAITGIDKLAQHAADLARELSHGLINIQVDTASDEATKSKLDAFFTGIQSRLQGVSDAVGKTAEDARNNVDKIVSQISHGKPTLLSALFGDKQTLDELKKEYADYLNFDAGAGVKPGSGVAPPGASSADADKAAADALTEAKYRLAAAQQTYEAELARTAALEEAGDITVSQADARNRQSITDYIAKIKQLQGLLPLLIKQQEDVGNAKGVAELKLMGLEIDKIIAKEQVAFGNTTFFGKIHSQLQQLINDWSDLGKQIGGFLTQQFQNFASGAGNAISGLIFRTTNWRQAILQLGESFVSSLATMLIQWVLARTVMSALNKAFGSADAQLVQQQGQAAAQAWAPAGIAASIASYGAAAGLGLTAFLASIGIGTAGATATAAVGGGGGGGFLEGGYTFGRAGQFAGYVHGEEFVFSAPAVRHFGVDFLHQLHSVGVTQPSTYQSNGAAPAGSSGVGSRSKNGNAPNFHFHVVSSPQESLRIALNHPQGEHYLFDLLNQKIHKLKRHG